MMDDNLLGFSSSQESLPLSQDTFRYLWDNTVQSEWMDLNMESVDNTNFEANYIPDATENVQIVSLESVSSTSSANLINDPSPPPSMNYIPSSLPASQNWPGDYDFKVFFGSQVKNTKGVAWTYSDIKDKLYVGKDVPCPINFSANCAMTDDVSIRALPLYSSPEHASEVVHRCANHAVEESQMGILEAEHLVRCESSIAKYDTDITTRRQSVVVPFENPPAGQEYSTYIYKFTCFGSCAGGPSRRPLMLIFSLEKGGQVIGRHKLDVKICACPGRDRRSEEKMLSENENKVSLKRKKSDIVSSADTLDITKSTLLPPMKKSKIQPNEDGVYIITAPDRECYDFLKQMKILYKINKGFNSLPLDVRKGLMQYNRQKNNTED